MSRFERIADIGRFALDRQLTRKGEDGTPALCCRERRTIRRHLLRAERAYDATGQHTFDEGVCLQDHGFSFAGRPELAEEIACGVGLMEILPARHRPYELHEGEAS